MTTLVRTRHAGWSEADAYVNFPQEVRLKWHVDRGGEAVLQARDAWDPGAPWRQLGRWGKGTKEPEKGEITVPVSGPSLLRFRARAPRFPRSGIASLRGDYQRRTLAILRGAPGTARRPVVLAEGYDPFNTQDWNDPTTHGDTAFAKWIGEGRKRYGLDLWILDWGDGGAPLEQQAEDFAEIARRVRAWNGGKSGTVAAGISMGAVSLRFALAAAADRGDDLGVRKYVSINGPHQGAWMNPKLLEFLRKRAARDDVVDPVSGSEAFLIQRGLGSPAARQLLVSGDGHKSFYSRLRSLGERGYHPRIPRVAFSNGTLVREGKELAEFVEGEQKVVHRISVRPLWLPLWVTMHRSRGEFRYGGYPGELLPASLSRPIREHVRVLGIFRLDFRARWEQIPTFIPTHSALDFPETLEGDMLRYRYTQWQKTAFSPVYVARGRNLAHDEKEVDWINPATGRGAPPGENAILYEIAR